MFTKANVLILSSKSEQPHMILDLNSVKVCDGTLFGPTEKGVCVYVFNPGESSLDEILHEFNKRIKLVYEIKMLVKKKEEMK